MDTNSNNNLNQVECLNDEIIFSSYVKDELIYKFFITNEEEKITLKREFLYPFFYKSTE
jgi:hypothetical protein